MKEQLDTESQIGDILARYWLSGNRYCGLAESQVLKHVNEGASDALAIDELHSKLLTMQGRGEVIIDGPETDPIVFPRRPLLEPRDSAEETKIGVYAKQLRLGGSQTALRYFNRQVLDRYRQDPRYEFKELAVSGRISTPSNVSDILPRDRVHIRFGRAYRPNSTPVVSAILFDLGELSREHQQYWTSYEVREDCQPDADFIQQNFNAKPIQRISPRDALLSELGEINKICKLIGEPELFRKTYEPGKLSKLGPITKPTAEEFRSFANELDKLLSQNINQKFFENKVALEGNGGNKKGTLMLLTEYLGSYGLGPSGVGNICEPLKRVRKYRQEPAHKVTEDACDARYWAQQSQLIMDAFKAIHLLRKVFEKHPSVKGSLYVPPKWPEGWRVD